MAKTSLVLYFMRIWFCYLEFDLVSIDFVILILFSSRLRSLSSFFCSSSSYFYFNCSSSRSFRYLCTLSSRSLASCWNLRTWASVYILFSFYRSYSIKFRSWKSLTLSLGATSFRYDAIKSWFFSELNFNLNPKIPSIFFYPSASCNTSWFLFSWSSFLVRICLDTVSFTSNNFIWEVNSRFKNFCRDGRISG